MKPAFAMHTTSTLKTLLWVVVFISSVSVVSTIRRNLMANKQFVQTARVISAQVLHTASQTRNLLQPE